MQFQGKSMIQIQKNDEKPHFRPDLGPLRPNSGRQFFFKNLALSLLRYHGQLLSCTILEKANDSILRKLSDERTDRQIDRRARVISYGAVQLTSSVQYKFFSRRTTISFKFKNCRKET